MFVFKVRIFQASLSYRVPYFGLLDDILKVAYGNMTCFAEFQMKFWLVLLSWFRKLSFMQHAANAAITEFWQVLFKIKLEIS